MTVVIDGVEYIPKNTIISDDSMRNLARAHSLAWAYGHYDPNNETEGKQMREICDALGAVNKELKFKK